MTSVALPPPADLGGALVSGGMMVNGANQMDRGEAMQNHAQAQYEASLPPTDGAGGGDGDDSDDGY